MRALLIAIAGFGVLAATPAVSQQYPPDVPVCLQVYGRANYSDCSYASISQCQISASGRSAQCIANPFYVGRQSNGPHRERRVRREY